MDARKHGIVALARKRLCFRADIWGMGRMPHSEMERQRNRAYALRKRHIRSTLRFEEIQRRIRNGRNRSEQDPQFLYCGAY